MAKPCLDMAVINKFVMLGHSSSSDWDEGTMFGKGNLLWYQVKLYEKEQMNAWSWQW